MPWATKGKPRTEQDKQAISAGTKAAMTPEVCKKITLNRCFSEEVREKMRQAHLKPISRELEGQIVELYVGGASQSIVASQLGISRRAILNALENRGITLRNLVEAQQLAFKLGRHIPLIISQAPGDKSPHWINGSSFEPYTPEFYKKRESVKERDDYQCQLCGVPEDECLFFDIHHIDYSKKNDADDNLISLCRGCHSKTNTNREYWQAYLSNLLERRQLNAISPQGS